MRRAAVVCVLCALGALALGRDPITPGPRYRPTKGEVWPRPQVQYRSRKYYTFLPTQVPVQMTGHTCGVVDRAIVRARDAWLKMSADGLRLARRGHGHGDTPALPPPPPTPAPPAYQFNLDTLTINLTAPCGPTYPYYNMDESYNLTVVGKIVKFTANSEWGVLRALETFNQLLYYSDDYKQLLINDTDIYDYPRYPHRGLLLDTGRHYLSLNSLYRTLDAMAMNKMNVFHWHIVEDQSFPYVSKKFPSLSERGAFDEKLVYSAADIRKLVEYAADLGIRVIPEFDVPGHTRSWGEAYPALLTKCYSEENETGLGPLNPINPDVYKLLKELFEEVQELFPDKFYHVGGDEVDRECWVSNPELAKYMRERNMTSQQLHALFMRRVMPLLVPGTTPLVWQEVFFERVPMSKNTLVQIWKPDDITRVLRQVIEAGHDVIYSSAWYLDHLDKSARFMYNTDPRRLVPPELAPHIVGGEACMWGEMVDDTNVLSRVWPRASAVAEVLWSAVWPRPERAERPQRPERGLAEEQYERAAPRLEEHTCRMRRRGIPAQPANGPSYCVLPYLK